MPRSPFLRRKTTSPAATRRKTLRFETLEDRKLMIAGPGYTTPVTPPLTIYNPPAVSVGTIDFNSQTGVVTINGTDNTYDTVKVTIDGRGTPTALDDLVTVSLQNNGPAIVKQFNQYTQGNVMGVTSLIFNAYGQPDTFDNQTSVRSTVYGGAGDDTLLGGGNVDQFFGGDGNDWMDGRSGDDQLSGDGNDDWMFGDAGNDTLYGGTGNDHLLGGLGSDRLYGEIGNDFVEGGPGSDAALAGGAGADTFNQFVYSPKMSTITYTDFNTADGDVGYSSYSTKGWFDNALADPMVRSLVRLDDRDSLISRSDMLGIYQQVGQDGWVYTNELNDLKSIAASLLVMPQDVRNLSGKLAFGDAANGHYQGATLGNLAANDSAGKLQLLVNKWFKGFDRPTADAGTSYQYVFGTLFVNGPQYSDIDQESNADCYFLAPLAETARLSPSKIASMFTDNGDGTYSVRFFRENGGMEYVTVDRYLPINAAGKSPYAGFGGTYQGSGNELWVALAEKAYAQLDESGWIGQDNNNTYHGIDFGFADKAYTHITGKTATATSVNDANAFNSAVTAFQSGKALEFNTKASGVASNIVANHSYAAIGYDAATKKFLLYNPWGYNSSSKPGEVWLTWAQIQSNCTTWVNGNV